MEKLYYKNQYLKEFIANIVEIIEIDGKYHIILDKTAFFPGGGGQWCDLGTIDKHNVIDVYENNNKIYHVIENKPTQLHNIKCSIDWDRREDGMHQHLAQHVLSGTFYTLFNKNTVAVHLGSEISTVDIEGYLKEEEIREAEIYANNIINNNIEVDTLLPSKKELRRIWIRRDLPDTTDEIRILKIGDLDSNACCGVHPKSTLDLRAIKLKKYEKNKGATRIEFLSGKRAIDYFLNRDLILIDVCRQFSSTEDEITNSLEGMQGKLEDALYKNKKLEEEIASYEINRLINESETINGISVILQTYEDKELKYISKIAGKINDLNNSIGLFGIKNKDKVNLIYTSSKDIKNIQMNDLLKDAMKLVDGKGGGNPNLAQAGGRNNGNLEATLNYTLSRLKTIL